MSPVRLRPSERASLTTPKSHREAEHTGSGTQQAAVVGRSDGDLQAATWRRHVREATQADQLTKGEAWLKALTAQARRFFRLPPAPKEGREHAQRISTVR